MATGTYTNGIRNLAGAYFNRLVIKLPLLFQKNCDGATDNMAKGTYTNSLKDLVGAYINPLKERIHNVSKIGQALRLVIKLSFLFKKNSGGLVCVQSIP